MQAAMLEQFMGRGWVSHAVMQPLLATEAMLALYALLGKMLAGSAESARLFDEVMALRGVKQVSHGLQSAFFSRFSCLVCWGTSLSWCPIETYKHALNARLEH